MRSLLALSLLSPGQEPHPLTLRLRAQVQFFYKTVEIIRSVQIELHHNLNDHFFAKKVLKILSFMSILSFTSVKFALPPLPPPEISDM